jgi:hypothetical protein
MYLLAKCFCVLKRYYSYTKRWQQAKTEQKMKFKSRKDILKNENSLDYKLYLKIILGY